MQTETEEEGRIEAYQEVCRQELPEKLLDVLEPLTNPQRASLLAIVIAFLEQHSEFDIGELQSMTTLLHEAVRDGFLSGNYNNVVPAA